MMNDEWRMMSDEWLMMNDEWWMMNDEWWIMNDEEIYVRDGEETNWTDTKHSTAVLWTIFVSVFYNIDFHVISTHSNTYELFLDSLALSSLDMILYIGCHLWQIQHYSMHWKHR